MSKGKWQKEIPTVNGQYWIATQDGLSGGIGSVMRADDGTLLLRGPGMGAWGGWWWSEPLQEPAPPSKDAWDK